MIKMTLSQGSECWINPHAVRSLLAGSPVFSGIPDQDRADMATRSQVQTTRLRFIGEDGNETLVRGEVAEIAAQVRVGQRDS